MTDQVTRRGPFGRLREKAERSSSSGAAVAAPGGSATEGLMAPSLRALTSPPDIDEKREAVSWPALTHPGTEWAP